MAALINRVVYRVTAAAVAFASLALYADLSRLGGAA
jgi:hypothetical protein